MSRKVTHRTHWAKINPIEHAMYQASKLSIEERNVQMVPVIAALGQLETGNWDPHEAWNPIFSCLNRIESISKLNHLDAQEFIDRAQAAFVTALDRHKKTGACAFKADELATIREIVDLYGQLLGEISRKAFAQACNHTSANVARLLSQKNGPAKRVAGCVIEVKNTGATAAQHR